MTILDEFVRLDKIIRENAEVLKLLDSIKAPDYEVERVKGVIEQAKSERDYLDSLMDRYSKRANTQSSSTLGSHPAASSS